MKAKSNPKIKIDPNPGRIEQGSDLFLSPAHFNVSLALPRTREAGLQGGRPPGDSGQVEHYFSLFFDLVFGPLKIHHFSPLNTILSVLASILPPFWKPFGDKLRSYGKVLD